MSGKPRLARLRSLLDSDIAGDEDALHELRGHVMRLRVWLRLGGWHVLDDDLRRLRRLGGELRDLGLYLARRPPPTVAAALELGMARARRRLEDGLAARERNDALLTALDALPEIEERRAWRRVARLAHRCLRCGHHALRHHQPSALHALRRVARRLRYALEWLGRRPRELLRLVRKLGDVGDRIAALRILGATHVEAPEHRRVLEDELRHHAKRARRSLERALPTFEVLARCSSS